MSLGAAPRPDLSSAARQSRSFDESNRVAAVRPARVATVTATILVVDDEPDLEALLQQKFRRQIRGGEIDFLFAHDGAEALEMLSNGQRKKIPGPLIWLNFPSRKITAFSHWRAIRNDR